MIAHLAPQKISAGHAQIGALPFPIPVIKQDKRISLGGNWMAMESDGVCDRYHCGIAKICGIGIATVEVPCDSYCVPQTLPHKSTTLGQETQPVCLMVGRPSRRVRVQLGVAFPSHLEDYVSLLVAVAVAVAGIPLWWLQGWGRILVDNIQ